MKEPPANNLKKCRTAMGYTQAEAAAFIHVDAKTMYRYEKGLQYPNVYTALRLAEYYHQSVGELFPLSQVGQE